MNLPCKYTLIGSNLLTDGYLCELNCFPISTELYIQMAIYKIPNSNLKTVSDAIAANASNKDFYDKINKSLLGKTNFDAARVQSTIIDIYNTLNSQNTNSRFIFNFRFATNPVKLNISYIELKNIYDYFQDYAKNYNTWKMTYFSQNEVKEQQQQTINNKVNRPIATIVDKKESNTEQQVDINIVKDLNFEKCLNDLLLFTHDNFTLYFLNKYINLYVNDNRIENEYNVSISDDTLSITIEPLIPMYLVLFSNSFYNSLKRIYLNLSSVNNSIRHNNLFNIFKQIIFICQFIIENPDKYKNEMHLILKLYLMLFFLYSLTFSNIQNVNVALSYPKDDKKLTYGLYHNIEQIIQPIFDHYIMYINTSKLNYTKIIIHHPILTTYTDQNFEKLKEIIKNNQYLKTLQNDEDYINTIKKEYFADDSTDNTTKEIQFEYNHQKIIDIDNYIGNNLYPSPLLQYQILKTEFNQSVILTQEYYHLLLLMGNYINLESNKLSPLIKRYCDIIQHKIIPDIINAFKDRSIKQPISTINLLNSFISIHLPKGTSIETEFQILYRIIIPFLYDRCKIKLFLDCFH